MVLTDIHLDLVYNTFTVPVDIKPGLLYNCRATKSLLIRYYPELYTIALIVRQVLNLDKT